MKGQLWDFHEKNSSKVIINAISGIILLMSFSLILMLLSVVIQGV